MKDFTEIGFFAGVELSEIAGKLIKMLEDESIDLKALVDVINDIGALHRFLTEKVIEKLAVEDLSDV